MQVAGELKLENIESFPFSFEFEYDSDLFDNPIHFSPAIRCDIYNDEKLKFCSTTTIALRVKIDELLDHIDIPVKNITPNVPQ